MGDVQRVEIGHLYKKSFLRSDARTIYLGQDILIGRDHNACSWPISESTISGKHLRIYSIDFDFENDATVAPLVYAADLSRNGVIWNDTLIGKGQSVLLSDCDELALNFKTRLVFKVVEVPAGTGDESWFKSKTDTLKPYTPLQQRDIEVFSDAYEMSSRMLGSGGDGKVFMAVNRQLGKQVACKIVVIRDALRSLKRRQTANKGLATKVNLFETRRADNEAVIQKLLREVEILKSVSHPNIISLERVYRSTQYIYIFQELVTRGDLFSYITAKGGKLHQAESGVITMQLLEALKYLHAREIVHRDIKPENILVASLREGARIILSDFGHATANSKHIDRRMLTVTGTPGYSAPQGANKVIQHSGYTKAVDMWNVGVVATVLLTGQHPFCWPPDVSHEQIPAVDEETHNNEIENLATKPDWQQLSAFPKDFIRKLLVLNEKIRLTAEQALHHEWFTGAHHTEYKKVYEKAISGWKRSTMKCSIEVISSQEQDSSRTSARRTPKPIEAHYSPAHRNVMTTLHGKSETRSATMDKIIRNASASPSGFVRPKEYVTPTQASNKSASSLKLSDTGAKASIDRIQKYRLGQTSSPAGKKSSGSKGSIERESASADTSMSLQPPFSSQKKDAPTGHEQPAVEKPQKVFAKHGKLRLPARYRDSIDISPTRIISRPLRDPFAIEVDPPAASKRPTDPNLQLTATKHAIPARYSSKVPLGFTRPAVVLTPESEWKMNVSQKRRLLGFEQSDNTWPDTQTIVSKKPRISNSYVGRGEDGHEKAEATPVKLGAD